MKQKKIGDILYVFQVTPYEITEDTDAEVIKVQEEVLKGFVELNESLVDKFVPYNYHVMCVNVPEWAPYVDQPDPEPPVVENYTFTLYPGAERGKVYVNFSDGQARQAIVDDTHTPGMENPINIEGYGEYEGYVYTYEVPENMEITLRPIEPIYLYTYDNEVYSYDGETQLLTPSIVMNADQAVYCIYADNRSEATLSWSEGGATVTIGADDNVFPTLNNPDNLTVSYSSTMQSVATIDENGNITLVSEGYTYIRAQFAGSESYKPVTAGYELVVNAADQSTYTFKLEGYNIHTNCTINVNNEATSYTVEELVDGVQLNDGDVIDVYPTENPEDYTLISGATWDTDHWAATVDGADVTITINYTAPENNEEQPE